MPSQAPLNQSRKDPFPHRKLVRKQPCSATNPRVNVSNVELFCLWSRVPMSARPLLRMSWQAGCSRASIGGASVCDRGAGASPHGERMVSNGDSRASRPHGRSGRRDEDRPFAVMPAPIAQGFCVPGVWGRDLANVGTPAGPPRVVAKRRVGQVSRLELMRTFGLAGAGVRRVRGGLLFQRRPRSARRNYLSLSLSGTGGLRTCVGPEPSRQCLDVNWRATKAGLPLRGRRGRALGGGAPSAARACKERPPRRDTAPLQHTLGLT